MDKPLPGAKPGLLYVNSKIVSSDLSEDVFTTWYEGEHIPDIFKTGGIKEASRWKALDPSSERPFLALYPLEDLDFLNAPDFKAIPVVSEKLPGAGSIFDVANFDTRSYEQVQLFEPRIGKHGQANFVISAAFTPADDEDYDNWYRHEHLNEVSGITGWRKTERYQLLGARENRSRPSEKKIPDPPKYLTLHFFDGESLPEAELVKAGESEWTKKNMSTMKETQMVVFKKLSYHKH